MEAVERMVKAAQISLEDWAVLFAHLQHFPKDQREEVIERLGLDPAELARLEKDGNAALFAAMDAGDMDAVESFGRRVSDTKKRLRAEGKKVEDLGPRRKPKVTTSPLKARGSRAPGPAKASRVPPPPKASRIPPPPKSVRRQPAIPARPHPWLSLHQYACLRAETANASSDEAIGVIRARYGLDAASDTDEVAAWCVRFRDRQAFEEYQRLFTYFRATAPRT